MDMEAIAKLAQACLAANPVVVLGSGASAAHGLPGMAQLGKYLLTNITPNGAAEEDAWLLVRTALADGDNLEQALAGKSIPSTLTKKIVAATWRCVNDEDRSLFLKAVQLREIFPLSDLLKALFHSSRTTVDIVTTNYDRVAEYASNFADLMHSAGFMPGYIQAREGASPVSFVRAGKHLRTARIWKVHGSLDWFARSDGTTVAAPLFELPDQDLTPLIVTPGFNKYERTHDEPFRSAIQGADRALENAEGYLCVGFGFRDAHIEPKMLDRCRQKSLPITVIAHTLTEEARSFLRIKAGQRYLGIEATADGSRAYLATHPDGIDLKGQDYWSLKGFLGLIT